MEQWNVGRMGQNYCEVSIWWDDGRMAKSSFRFSTFLGLGFPHYSIIPAFHYSRTIWGDVR